MSVLLVEKEGHVVTLTVNRPEKLNALNEEVLRALAKAIDEIGNDRDVRCAILTGAGEKSFVAGADIGAMAEMTSAQARYFADMGQRTLARIEELPFPVIAAVNGFALGGGCEIALACDFIYASEKAKLGQPEVNLGVIPGFGGTQRLARRVGIGRARELCYTGDAIGAQEALRIGLVNAVVAPAELIPKVKEVAAKIASKGPLSIAQCKRALLRGADVALPVACELEAQSFAGLFGSADQREGMSAFLSKKTDHKFRGE